MNSARYVKLVQTPHLGGCLKSSDGHFQNCHVVYSMSYNSGSSNNNHMSAVLRFLRSETRKMGTCNSILIYNIAFINSER